MNIEHKIKQGKWIELAGWRVLVFDETGSTNDDSLALADSIEGEFVVWARHQTAGKGREDRQWHDSPGSSLTFSVLLRPAPEESGHLSRFTALAALALCDLLEHAFQLQAEIKWPNDVLIHRKKVCGILSEIRWKGTLPQALVIGIGINLRDAAFEQVSDLRFPATSFEAEGFAELDSLTFLEGLLFSLDQRREKLPSDDFIQDWNERLAFKDEFVPINNIRVKQKCFALKESIWTVLLPFKTAWGRNFNFSQLNFPHHRPRQGTLHRFLPLEYHPNPHPEAHQHQAFLPA